MRAEEFPAWGTVADAAKYTGTCARTIYRAIDAGRLTAARVSGRRSLRFKREYLDAWLESTAVPAVEVRRG